jgi:hypothetical protein
MHHTSITLYLKSVTKHHPPSPSHHTSIIHHPKHGTQISAAATNHTSITQYQHSIAEPSLGIVRTSRNRHLISTTYQCQKQHPFFVNVPPNHQPFSPRLRKSNTCHHRRSTPAPHIITNVSQSITHNHHYVTKASSTTTSHTAQISSSAACHTINTHFQHSIAEPSLGIVRTSQNHHLISTTYLCQKQHPFLVNVPLNHHPFSPEFCKSNTCHRQRSTPAPHIITNVSQSITHYHHHVTQASSTTTSHTAQISSSAARHAINTHFQHSIADPSLGIVRTSRNHHLISTTYLCQKQHTPSLFLSHRIITHFHHNFAKATPAIISEAH